MIAVKLSDPQGNVASTIGWLRLIKHLRVSEEINPRERVTRLEVDEYGVTFYLSTEPSQ